MNIGMKRKRVVLQSVTRAQDSFGDAADAATTLQTIWASVAPLKGDERSAAQVVHANVSHSVRFRWSSVAAGLKPDDRVMLGSRVFDIVAVMNLLEENREIELLCTERF